MAAAFLPSHLLPDETACSGTLILHSQNMRWEQSLFSQSIFYT
jgi:hypothetical protein